MRRIILSLAAFSLLAAPLAARAADTDQGSQAQSQTQKSTTSQGKKKTTKKKSTKTKSTSQGRKPSTTQKTSEQGKNENIANPEGSKSSEPGRIPTNDGSNIGRGANEYNPPKK